MTSPSNISGLASLRPCGIRLEVFPDGDISPDSVSGLASLRPCGIRLEVFPDGDISPDSVSGLASLRPCGITAGCVSFWFVTRVSLPGLGRLGVARWVVWDRRAATERPSCPQPCRARGTRAAVPTTEMLSHSQTMRRRVH